MEFPHFGFLELINTCTHLQTMYSQTKGQLPSFESQIHGQAAAKKSSTKPRFNPKTKATYSNYYPSQPQRYPSHYGSLSAAMPGLPDSPDEAYMTTNGSLPFLPRVSGASALASYSDSAPRYYSSIANKVRRRDAPALINARIAIGLNRNRYAL